MCVSPLNHAFLEGVGRREELGAVRGPACLSLGRDALSAPSFPKRCQATEAGAATSPSCGHQPPQDQARGQTQGLCWATVRGSLAWVPVPGLLPQGGLRMAQGLQPPSPVRKLLAPVIKKSRFFFGFGWGWTEVGVVPASCSALPNGLRSPGGSGGALLSQCLGPSPRTDFHASSLVTGPLTAGMGRADRQAWGVHLPWKTQGALPEGRGMVSEEAGMIEAHPIQPC